MTYFLGMSEIELKIEIQTYLNQSPHKIAPDFSELIKKIDSITPEKTDLFKVEKKGCAKPVYIEWPNKFLHELGNNNIDMPRFLNGLLKTLKEEEKYPFFLSKWQPALVEIALFSDKSVLENALKPLGVRKILHILPRYSEMGFVESNIAIQLEPRKQRISLQMFQEIEKRVQKALEALPQEEVENQQLLNDFFKNFNSHTMPWHRNDQFLAEKIAARIDGPDCSMIKAIRRLSAFSQKIIKRSLSPHLLNNNNFSL